MEINELKNKLEETQKKFPPHYPTKTHDVGKETARLVQNLEELVCMMGLGDANIAIQNIAGKMINEFLIATRSRTQNVNCDFHMSTQSMPDGKSFRAEFENMSFEMKYHNDGKIVLINRSHCDYVSYGEDYSNTVLTYRCDEPNQLSIQQIFENKSVCNSHITFQDDGIEMKKEFMILPCTRRYGRLDRCVKGTITRNEDDFFTASISLQVIGEKYDDLISQREIEKANAIPEIQVPITYFGSLQNDLNLLTFISKFERESLGSGAIQNLVYNYYSSEEDQEDFPELYEKGRKAIETSDHLEFTYGTWDIIAPLIHAPYSYDILNNVKKLVEKQTGNQKQKENI